MNVRGKRVEGINGQLPEKNEKKKRGEGKYEECS